MLKIYFLHKNFLQVLGVELHVANLLNHHLLHLVAVLLGLLPAALHRRVAADQPLLQVTDRLDGLLLALVTDLPGLLFTVLGVAVLFGLLGASLLLQLADLLGLEVTILLLHREGEDIGELLAISVDISLAHLYLDLSRDVVAILLRGPRADNLLLPIAVVLGGHLPLAVELHSVSAGHIVDNLLLHVAVRCLHVEAYSLHVGLDDPRAVLEHLPLAVLLVLGPASLLSVRLALVLEHHLLHLVAVGVLVDPIAPHVSLSNVRIVILHRSWGRVLLWRRWARVPRCWCRVLRRWSRVHRSWCGVLRSRCGVHRSWCGVLRSRCGVLRSRCRILRIGS